MSDSVALPKVALDAVDLGIGMQFTNTLGDIGEDAAAERVPRYPGAYRPQQL